MLKQACAWLAFFMFVVYAGLAVLAVGYWRLGVYLVLIGAGGLLATDMVRTYWRIWRDVRAKLSR